MLTGHLSLKHQKNADVKFTSPKFHKPFCPSYNILRILIQTRGSINRVGPDDVSHYDKLPHLNLSCLQNSTFFTFDVFRAKQGYVTEKFLRAFFIIIIN